MCARKIRKEEIKREELASGSSLLPQRCCSVNVGHSMGSRQCQCTSLHFPALLLAHWQHTACSNQLRDMQTLCQKKLAAVRKLDTLHFKNFLQLPIVESKVRFQLLAGHWGKLFHSSSPLLYWLPVYWAHTCAKHNILLIHLCRLQNIQMLNMI